MLQNWFQNWKVNTNWGKRTILFLRFCTWNILLWCKSTTYFNFNFNGSEVISSYCTCLDFTKGWGATTLWACYYRLNLLWQPSKKSLPTLWRVKHWFGGKNDLKPTFAELFFFKTKQKYTMNTKVKITKQKETTIKFKNYKPSL